MNWIKSALIGAAVLFAWCCISWTVLPWHGASLKTFHGDSEVMACMDAAASGSGVYLLPSPKHCKEGCHGHEHKKEHALEGATVEPTQGFALVVYSAHGYCNNMGLRMVKAFGVDLVAAFLAAYLLSLTALKGLMPRALFVLTLGVFAGVASVLPNWVWWNFSCEFTLLAIADLVVGWFLAGLAMAQFGCKK